MDLVLAAIQSALDGVQIVGTKEFLRTEFPHLAKPKERQQRRPRRHYDEDSEFDLDDLGDNDDDFYDDDNFDAGKQPSIRRYR